MRYIVYESDQITKELLYSTKGDTTEDIIKGLITHIYEGKFDHSSHICVNGGGIKNDTNLFIMRSVIDGNPYIYQVCEKVSDCTGFIIPGAWYIRKIGLMIQ